jgi:hypothetical protein
VSSVEANFRGEPVPAELRRLVAFDESAEGWYCEGFELRDAQGDELSSWSVEPAFAERLYVFAQANGSGSLYAIWRADPAAGLGESPVVVFGDEGGIHVAAGNLRDLLQILTFDSEPMVDHDGVSFYKGDDHEPSEDSDRYREWLSSEFGLEPVADPEPIVSRAQQEHGPAFARWLQLYVPE